MSINALFAILCISLTISQLSSNLADCVDIEATRRNVRCRCERFTVCLDLCSVQSISIVIYHGRQSRKDGSCTESLSNYMVVESSADGIIGHFSDGHG